MPIDSYVVQFRDTMDAPAAQAIVARVLADQGPLARLAEAPSPADAARRVWVFVAPYEVAALSDARAWEQAYLIRRRSDGFVVRAEPTFVAPGMADDESYGEGALTMGSGGGKSHLPESNDQQWALEALRIRGALNLLVGRRPGEVPGQGVIIAHPDTGLAEHPEVVRGTSIDMTAARNFMEVNRPAVDPLTGTSAGHGAATSSVFLSPWSVHIQPGVNGISPGATLVPLRMQDWVVHFQWGRLTQALYHAADSGCHIVSMSLGGLFAGDTLRDAIRYAEERGLILLAAAGNHTRSVVSPAKFREVIALAATNARDQLWSGSATGKAVAVAAPGESVWRGRSELDRHGQPAFTVERSAGTSYATAHTAGVCALWMHYHGPAMLRNAYGAQLGNVFRTLLRQSARVPYPTWPTREAGTGIVDAEALLQLPLPPPGAPAPLAVAVPPARAHAAAHLDEIAEIWNVSLTTARQRLATRMGGDPAAVDLLLSDYGAELSMQLHRASTTLSANQGPEPFVSAAPSPISASLLDALGGALP